LWLHYGLSASARLGFVSSASRFSYHGKGEASDLVSKTNNTSQAKKKWSQQLWQDNLYFVNFCKHKRDENGAKKKWSYQSVKFASSKLTYIFVWNISGTMKMYVWNISFVNWLERSITKAETLSY
jgi:hypothetical protein